MTGSESNSTEPSQPPESMPGHDKEAENGDFFSRFATEATRVTGGRWGFAVAMGFIAVWLVTGPIFRFSEVWQLVVNTVTSIVTFLMVFLIQNSQNRDSLAIQLKLDELIHALKGANDGMIDIEKLSDEQLERIGRRYRELASGGEHADSVRK